MRSIEERNRLVLDNLPLVKHLVRCLLRESWKGRQEAEDLLQAGTLGLLWAAERWDESKGVRFGTFAYRAVAGYMRRYRQENDFIRIPNHIRGTQRAGLARRQKPRRLHARPGERPLEVQRREESRWPDEAEWVDIHDAFLVLSPRQRDIVYRRLQGQYHRQIAEQLGINRELVRYCEKRAITRLAGQQK